MVEPLSKCSWWCRLRLLTGGRNAGPDMTGGTWWKPEWPPDDHPLPWWPEIGRKFQH